MREVWKFGLQPISGPQPLPIPDYRTSRVVHVDTQPVGAVTSTRRVVDEGLFVWVEVDTTDVADWRQRDVDDRVGAMHLAVVGTGQPVPVGLGGVGHAVWQHVGTATMYGGTLVWHVYHGKP